MKKFQKISDWAATSFGSPYFLLAHIVWWAVWISVPVEHFPYGLLTLLVSLESILLSGLILNATERTGNEDRRIINTDLKLDKHTNREVHEMSAKLDLVLEHLKDDKDKPN